MLSKKTYPHFLVFCFAILAAPLVAQQGDSLQFITIGSPGTVAKGKVKLTGRVADEATGEAIIGAILQLQPNGANDVTTVDGKFTLTALPGNYVLEISYLGYETLRAKLEIHGGGILDFTLRDKTIDLEVVTVLDRGREDHVRAVVPGVELLTIEKIERQSKFLGETDVLRSLQAVAGVTSAGEGASGINVRGGNTDEILIFMDGNLLFNPQHALGFFSLFHPDLVNDVTLYKGGSPARYGGRLSSVLDVRLREGNNQHLSVNGGLSIASSRLSVEGPLLKKKASFIVGARAGYFDWILKQTQNVDLRKSQAFFYDVTAKADARLTPTTKAGFTVFAADDKFRFAEEVKFDYATYSGSAYLKQLVGKKVNLAAQANVGQYISSLYDVAGNDQSQFINRIHYRRGIVSGFYQPAAAYQLEIGTELSRYEVLPGELKPVGVSILKPEKLPAEQGNELSFFVQNQWSVSEKLELAAGLRHTFYKNSGPDNVLLYEPGVPKEEETVVDSLQFSKGEKIAGYSGLEPHFSGRWSVGKTSSVKLGYNRSYQYLSQVSNTASALPISVWQLSNHHLAPQKADNFSVGYYRNFQKKPVDAHLELFYRKIYRLIDYKDFAQLLLNDHIETELLTGIGKAYGVEFYLHKNYGRHKFEGSYTWSRSLRQVEATATQEAVNAGRWYPSNYDKPHSLNVNYFWQMGTKVSLSMNFVYSTGRPTTAPISSYTNSNVWAIPIYSDRNQFRIPDYHRLDVALDIGPWGKKQGRENSLTLSVYNLYARKNAFSVFFRQQPAKPVTAYRLSVLGTAFPAITYNFKF
ncbi:MAG: TonB-dependent receptor [Bacteroidetes bacterium]|nr:TonB-dependent receptor [Bacteroidota bacterium]